MNDPAIWGPILIAAIVYVSAWSIEKRIEAATNERREQHNQMMEALNIFPDELSQIKMGLDSISNNTQPPGEDYD
jgi:hypothetical protein